MDVSGDSFKAFDSALSDAKAAQLRTAAAHGLLADHRAFSVVDFDALGVTVAKLKAAFPDHFTHTFAVKANYYLPVLAHLNGLGIGAEVASAGELELAVRAGFDPSRIVLDAPVKTVDEIERALALGVANNIDNFQEFDRIAQRLDQIKPGTKLGFRVNPQIGAGRIAMSSTATMTSKFGIGLEDPGNREKLVVLYLEHDWLNTIHVHVGSLGCPLELMAEGVAKIVALAKEINKKAGHRQITTIDMGGGLPVSFETDADAPEFSDYATILAERVPDLFNGEFAVVTEFGRAIIAKSAYTVARVEYTKVTGGRHIALTYAGAHNMVRLVYHHNEWARRVTALSPSGDAKVGDLIEQDIAGPCCFTGDIIAHQRALPLLEPGDAIMVHDTGAYCFSNHFNYNALMPDPVYGCHKNLKTGQYQFSDINVDQHFDQFVETYA